MKKNEKNNKKWIIIFIIAVFVIIAAAVAVIFGANKDDTGGSTTGTTTEVGTGSDASASGTTVIEADKENTYYWLITDKKTGITVDSEGWSDAKDYNGVSWAKAPTEKLPFVWCYATDPDGKVIIEPTLWYEFQATDNSTSTTTEVASSEKPSTEDTEEKPGSNTNNTGTGNNGGNNTDSTGNNVTPGNSSNAGNSGDSTGNTGSNGGNSGNSGSNIPTTSTTTESTTQASTTQAPAVCPPHDYVYVVTEEKGEYKEVVVQEGYWKPVKIGSYNQCNGCGINLSNMSEESMTAHLLRCTDDGTSYHLEPIWGEEWVEPVIETQWVVTEPAQYYFQCSVCGKISTSKNPYK